MDLVSFVARLLLLSACCFVFTKGMARSSGTGNESGDDTQVRTPTGGGIISLVGDTRPTLNKRPIGLHLKILNFNGRLSKPNRQGVECFLFNNLSQLMKI